MTFGTYTRGLYVDAIAGRRTDFLSGAIRSVAYFVSWPYTGLMVARNWLYRRGVLRGKRLPVPVVSVGNITCGGTGKTPLVEVIARKLMARGKRPAVVSRGYGRNDEFLVLRQNLPAVPHVSSPDRFAGGVQAVKEHGADSIVLDDGFQHLRLKRDVDIVVVDALNPSGYGSMVPRGFLREPVEGLRRADLIIVSRSDQLPRQDLLQLRRWLEDLCPGTPLAEAVHLPVALVELGGNRVNRRWLAGRRVAGFCAIGNPDSFRRTLQSAGVDLVEWRVYPDHYAYRASDLRSIEMYARQKGAEAIVTTQKDAVKLPAHVKSSMRLLELRIRMALGAGAAELDRLLAEV